MSLFFRFPSSPQNLSKWLAMVLCVSAWVQIETTRAEAQEATTPANTAPDPFKSLPTIEEQVVYKVIDGRSLKLYISKPKDWAASDHRPAFVFFHGGGWTRGQAATSDQRKYFGSRGLVGISVEYRLIPDDKTTPMTICCQDAKSAIRYIRAHASALGIDPDRIIGAGESAGGHLASFTAMVPGLDDPADDLQVSCKPNALVLYNPVFNNGPGVGHYGHNRVGDNYKEYSPADNITKDAPPMIVFIGDKDQVIPESVVNEFAAQMQKVGVRCDVIVYAGVGHTVFRNEPYRTLSMIESDNFLQSLGYLTTPSPLKVPEGFQTNSNTPPASPQN